MREEQDDSVVIDHEDASASAILLAEVSTTTAMQAYIKDHFSPDSTQEDIEDFLISLAEAGGDEAVRARAVDALVKPATALGKRPLNKLASNAWAAHRKVDLGDAKVGKCIVNEVPFHDVITYAINTIIDKNDANPFLFDFGGRPAVVRVGFGGLAVAEALTEKRFGYVLNETVRFYRAVGDNGVIGVAAPYEVRDHLFASDYDEWLLPLDRVVTVPHFDVDQNLVDAPGYHSESKTYFEPPRGLDWGVVPMVPTDADVSDAKERIVSGLLGDFPLGGLDRAGIERAIGMQSDAPEPDDEALASIAMAVAMILLPFMRQMIIGPTPGHVVTKPTAGTGAGFLVSAITIVGIGRRAGALAWPKNRDELTKTLM